MDRWQHAHDPWQRHRENTEACPLVEEHFGVGFGHTSGSGLGSRGQSDGARSTVVLDAGTGSSGQQDLEGEARLR